MQADKEISRWITETKDCLSYEKKNNNNNYPP